MMLVRELEVRYNYSGVKKIGAKSVQKLPAPFDFCKTISIFKVDFVQNQRNEISIQITCVFYMETNSNPLHSLKYISKK